MALVSEADVDVTSLLVGELSSSLAGILHARRLYMTFLTIILLFPSKMTYFSGVNFPGLLLLAEISVYFLLASFLACTNLMRSSSSSAWRFGNFLGGNLLMNFLIISFY